MSPVARAVRMAKKKPDGDRPKTRRMVDLDPDLALKVAAIAGALGLSVPDYVNTRLRPVVEKELPDVLKALGLDKRQ